MQYYRCRGKLPGTSRSIALGSAQEGMTREVINNEPIYINMGKLRKA
jgi:hypothetical protein